MVRIKWRGGFFLLMIHILHRTGAGAKALSDQASHEAEKWVSLSIKEKMGEWAYRHQYSIVLGTWALSMGVAGAIISRDRYQSTAQKVVQARMWAQGLTIGVLIAAGALTHSKQAEAAKRVSRGIFTSLITMITEFHFILVECGSFMGDHCTLRVHYDLFVFDD